MEKSSRFYGAGWILSSARLGFAGGVGKGRFFSHSGWAGRKRFSADFRLGGRGRAKNGHNGRFLANWLFHVDSNLWRSSSSRKRILTVVPAVHDVINRFRILHAQLARHWEPLPTRPGTVDSENLTLARRRLPYSASYSFGYPRRTESELTGGPC
jgi:hypothetical protein